MREFVIESGSNETLHVVVDIGGRILRIGRRGCLMVGVLDSISSSLGSHPGQGHCLNGQLVNLPPVGIINS